MSYRPGRYQVEISGQGFGELSNEKMTPFFFLEFQPQGIIDPESDELLPCESGERTLKLWITDKALPYTRERLAELGWQGARFSELDPGDNSGHSFVGVVVQLVCEHEQNGDNVYEQWRFPAGGSVLQHDPKVSKKLDALFGKQLKKDAVAKPAAEPAEAEAKPNLPF